MNPNEKIIINQVQNKYYRNIPIKENYEKLVSLRPEIRYQSYYYLTENNPPYNQRLAGSMDELFVRAGLKKKLIDINNFLDEFDLELFVFDAFRTQECQQAIYYWYSDWLRKNKDTTRQVTDFVAEPTFDSDTLACFPHGTGGTVDMWIADKDSGKLKPMGCRFDEFKDKAQADYYEDKAEKKIKYWRRLFFNILKKFELVINRNEIWDCHYGDQLWAKYTGKIPFYGYVKKI